ncbi:MAG: CNNM domain-containing protein [Balneolaceae bacterium]
MTLLIIYLLVAVGVSFLCSILEAVLLSITPSFIALKQQEGSKVSNLLVELKKDIDKPLSAILSLNTIAHTVGAAGVGAQAQVVFGNAYLSITSAILTLLILVFSEIIPKTLGANYWKELSNISARAIKILIYITYPLVLLSNGITRRLSKTGENQTLSREEFSAMADIGVEEGVFEEGESKIFKNLIRFSSLRAVDIMTPRIVVVRFSQETKITEALSNEEDLIFSRFPIYGKGEEDIVGYVLKNDLYKELSKGNGDWTLNQIKRNILIFPEKVQLKLFFEKIIEQQEHIAAIVDEYGGFSGIVTMEDVVETLLGLEIVDEADTIEDMQKLARRKWRERAKKMGISVPNKSESVAEPPKEDSK